MKANLLKRFYIFQNERFPLKILLFTTSAVILSSAAILDYEVSILQMVLAMLACLAFLYHVRVIDESRDNLHDQQFHPERPVPRGLISIKELFFLNLLGLGVFIAISVFYKETTIAYGMALMVFSFFAWKEFFMAKWLKKRFYLYNAVNMMQMVLLQLYIYAVFTQSFKLNTVMLVHGVFVIWNTFIMEVARKIKPKSDEPHGAADTYSAHMGFGNAIILYLILVTLNLLTFAYMIFLISEYYKIYTGIALFIFLLILLASFTYNKRRQKKQEGALLLLTVVNYVVLNMLIYFY